MCVKFKAKAPLGAVQVSFFDNLVGLMRNQFRFETKVCVKQSETYRW